VFQHFSHHFATPPTRSATLNWEELGLQQHNLQDLENEFTEGEMKAVIEDIAAEKAPGPDGYIGVFLKKC